MINNKRCKTKIVLRGVALLAACLLCTAANASFIFDFEFEQQRGVPVPINGTIEFTTANSDDGGSVILDYIGEIHSHSDDAWVPNAPFRWDFSDTSAGFFPVYDIITRWTVPGSAASTFPASLAGDDAFVFSWDPGFAPNLLASRAGLALPTTGLFTGPTFVPEPTIFGLFGAGLFAMGFSLRRKRTA